MGVPDVSEQFEDMDFEDLKGLQIDEETKKKFEEFQKQARKSRKKLKDQEDKYEKALREFYKHIEHGPKAVKRKFEEVVDEHDITL